MSMELLVVLAMHRAPTVGTWQQALNELKVSVQFAQKVDLSTHSGFLPLTVNGHKSGFYFLTENTSEIVLQYPPLAKTGFEKPIVYSLGYGGDFRECASVFYSASALVSKFGGKAFEPQAGTFMGVNELVETARQCDELAGKP